MTFVSIKRTFPKSVKCNREQGYFFVSFLTAWKKSTRAKMLPLMLFSIFHHDFYQSSPFITRPFFSFHDGANLNTEQNRSSFPFSFLTQWNGEKKHARLRLICSHPLFSFLKWDVNKILNYFKVLVTKS